MGKNRPDRKTEKERAHSLQNVRVCIVDRNCLEDLQWWARVDARICEKALALIEHILRDPFTGTGKPEPLKQLGPNTWSRRLTAEHRLVYVVFDDKIKFVQARYHY